MLRLRLRVGAFGALMMALAIAGSGCATQSAASGGLRSSISDSDDDRSTADSGSTASDPHTTFVTIPSGPGLADLGCASAPAEKQRPPVLASPTEPVIGAGVPTVAELGPLARMVRVQPPALDRAAIAGFDLSGRSGAPRPRRIAFWGDSHIAAGPMMNQLRQAVLNRGETVGARFLPPTMGRSNVRLSALHGYCIGPAWTTDLAYKSSGTLETGPGLANRIAEAGSGAYLWLDLRTADRQPQIADLKIVYQPTDQPATLAVSINGGPEVSVPLTSRSRAPGVASAALGLRSSAPISTMKMRVSAGKLVLGGFILDYQKPPTVTFDVFGVPSSTIDGWASVDPAAMTQALHGDTYDAVGLEYGTNEGNVQALDAEAYTARLTAALTNMRAVFPRASCVLMGPPDRGILVGHARGSRPDYLKFARIHQQIAAIQASVGARFNCVTWNWQKFMGGPGGIYGWVHNSPSLAGSDLTHMTSAGYRMTGAALAKSLGWINLTVDAIPTH